VRGTGDHCRGKVGRLAYPQVAKWISVRRPPLAVSKALVPNFTRCPMVASSSAETGERIAQQRATDWRK